jgi:galactosyl transferase GMA12/MNN10 family
MYAIYSHHDSAYQELADITWYQNKLLYAEKHGYAAHVKTDNFRTATNDSPMTGFEKIHMAKEILQEHPEYEWLWWTGTDSMITNMNIRIEDRIFNNYHFIVAVDINGINADSFLIRNSPEGHIVLDDILSKEQECHNNWDKEQLAMSLILGLPGTGRGYWPPHGPITVCEKYQSIAKILPQKYMNSYDYNLYREYEDHRDRLGVNGNWSYGDWLMHWPGTSLQMRVALAKHYSQYVVR